MTPATARKAERPQQRALHAQVIAAMTPAMPSQPATIRGRTSSSMPEMTRQSMAQSKAHTATMARRHAAGGHIGGASSTSRSRHAGKAFAVPPCHAGGRKCEDHSGDAAHDRPERLGRAAGPDAEEIVDRCHLQEGGDGQRKRAVDRRARSGRGARGHGRRAIASPAPNSSAAPSARTKMAGSHEAERWPRNPPGNCRQRDEMGRDAGIPGEASAAAMNQNTTNGRCGASISSKVRMLVHMQAATRADRKRAARARQRRRGKCADRPQQHAAGKIARRDDTSGRPARCLRRR